MDQSRILFVGLDVHKDSIDIALAEASRDAPVRHLATVAGGSVAVTKALRRLISAGHQLHIVYEAGPCGFALARHFAALGWHCDVVAPSSIPRASGERVKTDRRDALKLARLARVGELTAVRVPDSADEAIRDLVRGREDAVREQRNARHRLQRPQLLDCSTSALAGHVDPAASGPADRLPGIPACRQRRGCAHHSSRASHARRLAQLDARAARGTSSFLRERMRSGTRRKLFLGLSRNGGCRSLQDERRRQSNLK
jgi:transposase